MNTITAASAQVLGASAAMVSVFGVLVLVGLVPLYVYFYVRNLVSVAP